MGEYSDIMDPVTLKMLAQAGDTHDYHAIDMNVDNKFYPEKAVDWDLKQS